jgi:hypothetical protein
MNDAELLRFMQNGNNPVLIKRPESLEAARRLEKRGLIVRDGSDSDGVGDRAARYRLAPAGRPFGPVVLDIGADTTCPKCKGRFKDKTLSGEHLKCPFCGERI